MTGQLGLLTDHGQVDPGVERGRRLEVGAAPVDALVALLDVSDAQQRRQRQRVELGPTAQRVLVGPVGAATRLAAARVVTAGRSTAEYRLQLPSASCGF